MELKVTRHNLMDTCGDNVDTSDPVSTSSLIRTPPIVGLINILFETNEERMLSFKEKFCMETSLTCGLSDK